MPSSTKNAGLRTRQPCRSGRAPRAGSSRIARVGCACAGGAASGARGAGRRIVVRPVRRAGRGLAASRRGAEQTPGEAEQRESDAEPEHAVGEQQPANARQSACCARWRSSTASPGRRAEPERVEQRDRICRTRGRDRKLVATSRAPGTRRRRRRSTSSSAWRWRARRTPPPSRTASAGTSTQRRRGSASARTARASPGRATASRRRRSCRAARSGTAGSRRRTRRRSGRPDSRTCVIARRAEDRREAGLVVAHHDVGDERGHDEDREHAHDRQRLHDRERRVHVQTLPPPPIWIWSIVTGRR